MRLPPVVLPSFSKKPPPSPASRDTPTQALMRRALALLLKQADLPAITVPVCETLLAGLSGEQLEQFADVLSDFAAQLQRIRSQPAA